MDVADEAYKEGETLINLHGDTVDSDDRCGEFPMEHSEDQLDHIAVSTYPSASVPSQGWANCYLSTTAIMASLGGILFGYDIGIISGAILQIQDVFCLTCLDQEFVVSSMLIGAVLGSIIGGFFIDGFGRRHTIMMNDVIFLIGAIALGVASNFAVLVVGRLLVGFAVSVSAMAECIYISEIAPANRRGLFVSLNELGITLGLLLAYFCNFLFIDMPNGWRWMFGLSAIPAITQGIGMVFLPNSPRFLMLKKNETGAKLVLKKLRGTNKVDKEISGIRVSIASERNQGCLHLCGSENGMRGRMLVAIGLVIFQQFTGQPNVLYYAPTIFEVIGFQSNSAATLATVGLGTVKVVMTVVALLCVDKFGRRKLLFIGSLLMGISIFTLGLVCHFDGVSSRSITCTNNSHCHSTIITTSYLSPVNQYNFLTQNITQFRKLSTISSLTEDNNYSSDITEFANSTPGVQNVDAYTPNVVIGENSTEKLEKGNHLSHNVKWRQIIGFLSLMCYVAAYGFSFGPVTWLVLSEIFPAAVKGRAIALATVFNWGTNLIVTFTFLDIMNALGVTWTFTLFAVICGFSVLFIYSFVPETKDKTLEQVSAIMKNKSPLEQMKSNWSQLPCCAALRKPSDVDCIYSRVQSDTVV